MAAQKRKSASQLRPAARRPSEAPRAPARPAGGRVTESDKQVRRGRSYGRGDPKRERRTRLIVIVVVVALILSFAAGLLAMFLGSG